jgi:hypothetical protein
MTRPGGVSDAALQVTSGLGVTATRKWRRKPLKWLKTDSEMAPGRFAVAGKANRSGEFQSFTTVRSGAAGFFMPTTW